MDGVLIEAKDWHYEALNIALGHFGESISREEHENKFDGLPTRVKLQILSERRGFPKTLHQAVSEIKQIETIRLAAQHSRVSVEHIRLLENLRKNGVKLAVATNSIRITTEVFLRLAGIWNYFDVVTTNEDVPVSKPSPDVYLLTCQKLGIEPSHALAIEDSEYGVASARNAGCHVIQIDSPSELGIINIGDWIRVNEHN